MLIVHSANNQICFVVKLIGFNLLSYTWWPTYYKCFICLTLTWQRVKTPNMMAPVLHSVFPNRNAFNGDFFTACWNTVLQLLFRANPLKAECDSRLFNPIADATVWYLQHTMQIYELIQLDVWHRAFCAFDSPTDKVTFLNRFTRLNFLDSKSPL